MEGPYALTKLNAGEDGNNVHRKVLYQEIELSIENPFKEMEYLNL